MALEVAKAIACGKELNSDLKKDNTKEQFN